MHYAGIIGDPVAHSRSPQIHNAAFEHIGMAARYEHWPTPAAELPARIAALRRPEMLGANVTLPHKTAVIPLLDEIEPEAARIGAVNTIYRRADGALVGANTDAPGLAESLREDAGFAAQGARVLLLGARGAARAAVYALLDAGVAELIVANRTLARAEDLLADVFGDDDALPAPLRPPGITDDDLPSLLALALDDPELAELIPQVDLLINATSLGWHGDETPLANPPLRPAALVYDMVYRPSRLLRDAAACGARTCDGVGMLLRQGVLSFFRWTGRRVPIEVMRAALGEV
jgi:shikimate dehydrogenase